MTTPSSQTRARRRRTRLVATAIVVPLALAGIVVAVNLPADATGTPASLATAVTDRTSPAQARLVDQVPTPVLHWTTCQQVDQCATAELPLNYDDPHGATIGIALLRVRAKDPSHRIGTIFVNPGGPGDSARDFAAVVPQALPQSILDRFDIVGVDPRGVGGSTQIRCFTTKAEQTRTERPFTATSFPDTRTEESAWIGAAQSLGRACAGNALPIASAMSTTEDARDMDVLRRAVGDRQLTYVGESYGTYLGEVYANMFPDRVRAVALDGVVDPLGLVGTPATEDVPTFDRVGSGAASYRALHELLRRCQQVGQSRCPFADADTQARFDQLADRLRAHPLRLAAPGVGTTTFTYPNLIFDIEQWLHDPNGYQGLFADLTDLAQLTAPGGAGADQNAVVARFLARHPATPPTPGYDNHLEAQLGEQCADGRNASDATAWPAAAAAADRSAPYFGAFYAWVSVQCASDTWTAQDPNVYQGPFDRRTAAPVMVVGARWDPVTSYDSAVEVARLLPNSRLVSSDSWGHEALTTSACVDDTVYDYVIDPLAPAPKTTFCQGDVQPFASAPPTG